MVSDLPTNNPQSSQFDLFPFNLWPNSVKYLGVFVCFFFQIEIDKERFVFSSQIGR